MRVFTVGELKELLENLSQVKEGRKKSSLIFTILLQHFSGPSEWKRSKETLLSRCSQRILLNN